MSAVATFFLFFLLVSPLEASAVIDDAYMPECSDCHYRLPFPKAGLSFNEGIADICSRCHLSHHGKNLKNSHIVSGRPSMPVPKDLPLDIKNNLSCITCHTFHVGHNLKEGSRKSFLRREKGKTFCYSCHKKTLAKNSPFSGCF